MGRGAAGLERGGTKIERADKKRAFGLTTEIRPPARDTGLPNKLSEHEVCAPLLWAVVAWQWKLSLCPWTTATTKILGP